MPATIFLAGLAKTLGPMVASALLEKLSNSRDSEQKFKRAMDMTTQGVTVLAALKSEFGDAFQEGLSQVMHTGSALSFESGTAEYIQLPADQNDDAGRICVLRDEVNVNLDRVCFAGKNEHDELTNYYRGVLSVWKRRYISLLGSNEDAATTFSAIDDLLDDSNKTFKDVLERLVRTGLGTGGALMTICGVFLATGTSVGLASSISMFLVGIPWLSVGALVVPGAILVGLSLCQFGSQHKLTMCTSLTYRLLDRRLAASLNGSAQNASSEVPTISDKRHLLGKIEDFWMRVKQT